MYHEQARIVKAAIEALQSEAPSLFEELKAEQKAAATGLEYYGITASKFSESVERNAVTEETKSKLRAGIRAVQLIYQS